MNNAPLERWVFLALSGLEEGLGAPVGGTNSSLVFVFALAFHAQLEDKGSYLPLSRVGCVCAPLPQRRAFSERADGSRLYGQSLYEKTFAADARGAAILFRETK
ncbi:hypothetical protein RRG08_048630 [Elysia crispata]|uniref:Uncharacterized protein n=1 Tax=Elysia crispata TaxID=231223 RepID=A0AAE1ADZ2_9GAST|nr:hypothetical protein RRG08_048630 [Elysia crispata]